MPVLAPLASLLFSPTELLLTASIRWPKTTKKSWLYRCWKHRVGTSLESVMPVPICNWGFVYFCWGTATCYDGYLWGAKHKSFPSERGGRLVKNETPGKQWWEKKNEAERNDTLYGYLVKNTNIETLNRTPWEYISLLKRCCLRRSIKTIEYEKAHRMGWCIQGKSHKSYNGWHWEQAAVTDSPLNGFEKERHST